MIFVQPEVKLLKQEYTLEGAFKMAEYAGRVCYQSMDKTGSKTPEEFVNMLLESGHGEPVEHATLYLKWDAKDDDYSHKRYNFYKHNKYSVLKTYEDDRNAYVTTNYRVLVENNRLNDVAFICEPIKGKHEPRITVQFISQNVIAKEAHRHDSNSKSELSTRYCNFSKDKFGHEINVNVPTFVDEKEIEQVKERKSFIQVVLQFLNELQTKKDGGTDGLTPVDYWYAANAFAEFCYMKEIEGGWVAQQARTILPLDVNTMFVHTAFLSDWKHFLALRYFGTTGAPHPDMKILAEKLYNIFVQQGYVNPTEVLK